MATKSPRSDAEDDPGPDWEIVPDSQEDDTLKRFCKKEADGIEWDECLKAVNQAVAEVYLLANFYVLRQLEASRPICKIDQGFYQTCLSLVTNKTRTQRSLRQQYDDVVLKQAKKEAKKRWKQNGRVGKMKDVPVDIPEFSESDFEALSTKKDVDLENAGYEFMQLRGEYPPANAQHLNQGWFQAVAKQMATNARNAIVRNFTKRLRSYVIDFYGLNKENVLAVVNGIFAETFEHVYVRVADPIVMQFRREIPRTVKNTISWEPRDLLPFFYRFLQYIEKQNKLNKDVKEYQEKRTFSLLPTKRGFEASYCKVDSTGLRALLLCSPRVNRDLTIVYNGDIMTLADCLAEENRTSWISMADQWWRRLFHVDRLEQENKRSFHQEITTDGYGVGVHMNRPTRGKVAKKKKKKMKKEKDENISDALGIPLRKTPQGRTEDYDVIWGIDPGRTDFITAINHEGRSVRFRTSDFRRASGYSRSNRKSKRRIDRSRRVRELLQKTPTKKTASLTKLTEAILFTFEHVNELLTFFLDSFFRKLKFSRYTLRTAQLDRACFELAGSPGTKTIIGFGDSGAAGEGMIKNSPAGPVKAFVRKLARYCEVVVVDEYKTSKVHHDCRSVKNLENQRVKRVCRDGILRSVPVHKVLHCVTKNGGCGKTVDRDVNAAKSIRNVLQRQLTGDLERPSRLQRATRPRH